MPKETKAPKAEPEKKPQFIEDKIDQERKQIIENARLSGELSGALKIVTVVVIIFVVYMIFLTIGLFARDPLESVTQSDFEPSEAMYEEDFDSIIDEQYDGVDCVPEIPENYIHKSECTGAEIPEGYLSLDNCYELRIPQPETVTITEPLHDEINWQAEYIGCQNALDNLLQQPEFSISPLIKE